MAEAAPRQYDIKDLTQCGICLLVLQQPKALPCLHSFCLKCLSQWAQGKTTVTCPLCVQEFQIPSGGVSSFTTNFFINTLKERDENAKTVQSEDRVAPCATCETLESKLEGYCSSCNGFICGDCISSHSKIKQLKDHKIIMYADLQSGKVDIKSIHQRQHCKIHEEQILRFYCETCRELICLGCTVVDHPATKHCLVNLESAIKDQKTEIEQLTQNCDDVRKKINGSLVELDVLSETLAKNATKTEEDINEAFYNEVKMLEDNRKKLTDEVKMIVLERKKEISAEKDEIQLQQTRVATALQMATEVLQTGSDYDMAQVYSSLKSNLTTLCDLKPTPVRKSLGNVSFKPTPTKQLVMRNLGSISSHVKKGVGVWKVTKSFGDTGNGKLRAGRDIAITQENDIVVTDMSGKSMKRYDTNGYLKSVTRIDRNPWCIKISQDGRVFVTDGSKHVSVYDNEMSFKQQFAVISPDGVSSDRQNTYLRGLAFDNHNMLLVGERNHKYVSKHRLDGSHVMSYNVSIQPWYILVSSQDKVIVSSWDDEAVHILDEQGNHLRNVKPPPGISSWEPWGSCCTSDDEVYIANCKKPRSIDIYSTESGDYIGCLTKDVTNPRGLTLMDNENKLLVVEDYSVKIFQQNEE